MDGCLECVAVSAAYLGRDRGSGSGCGALLALSPSFSLLQCRRWIFFRDDETTEMFIEGSASRGSPE